MTAIAHVAHATSRRVRIRVPSERRNARFFEHVEDVLAKAPAVTKVAVNARTGSVLVFHRGELSDLVEHARARDLFDVRPYDPPARSLEALRKGLLQVNVALRRRTDGALDLRTVGFAALLGGGVYQVFRGDVLPAGTTMLIQALDLVFGGRRSDD